MGASTNIGGILIPSTSPVFLATVGFHVLTGLACIVIGLLAMLSLKRRGMHSNFGTIYFYCLTAAFTSATALAVVRKCAGRCETCRATPPAPQPS